MEQRDPRFKRKVCNLRPNAVIQKRSMALRIPEKLLDLIRSHSAREYPNECCGCLVGKEVDSVKEVREVTALVNLRGRSARADELLPLEAPDRESERNRFLIDPDDLRRVEQEARRRKLEILGFYHSHPDHPARPSDYDRDHAFPWYSYVIIAVEAGRPGVYASWMLREDRSAFDAESVEVAGSKTRDDAASGQAPEAC